MKMYRLRHLLIDESCQYVCALDCDSFFCLVCCEITVTLQQPIILYLAWYEYALFETNLLASITFSNMMVDSFHNVWTFICHIGNASSYHNGSR
mmetsp:Transcript_25524/g.31358  ORF Transcript_25524/g.31358 Transcript_25524/m.31358 type:complete len:94 (+) Transcript_25524:46-327(+)